MESEVLLENQPKKHPFRKILKEGKGWLFILPSLLLLAMFTFYPLVRSVIYAFQNNADAFGYDGWGVENFQKVFTYGKFSYNLVNTLIFAFISVPVSTILALLISVGLNAIKPLREIFQTIFFIPYLTNAIAIGSVFATMFTVISAQGTVEDAQSLGLINTWFGTKIDWTRIVSPITDGSAGAMWKAALTDKGLWLNRTVVLIFTIWEGLPFKILILFGALQNVNKQYYDAAKIDGASKWTTLRKITVPLISPMLSYLIVTGFIGGFKAYSSVIGIFGKDKVSGTEMNTMVGYIMDTLHRGQLGLSAAGALALFVIILIFTFFNLRMSKKRVHY